MSHHWQRWCRFTVLFLANLLLCISIHNWSSGQWIFSAVALEMPTVISISQVQLVQRGIEFYQAGKFTEAIATWEQSLPQITTPKDKAIVHTNLAVAYRQIGQLPQAIAQWEQALQIYRTQEDKSSRKALATSLTEQAQAYSDLGQHQRSITLLESAISLAVENQDPLIEAAAQGALGNAHWALGNYDQALVAQQTSLKIARQLNNTRYIATALNNLGNIYVSQATRYSYQAQLAQLEGDDQQTIRLTQAANQDRAQARTFFEQSAQTAQQLGGLEEVRALMNLNHLIIRSHLSISAGNSLKELNRLQRPLTATEQEFIIRNGKRVKELLVKVPDSWEKAYTLINLAENYRNFESGAGREESLQLLEQALSVARTIGDARAESFALGSLGQWYEKTGDYDKAMELTRNAQFAAQQINAPDSLYHWQWQAGRILKATGDTQDAITAYQEAIASLQSIRGDLIAANQDLQLDFREQVEPVYRELMELLLTETESGQQQNEGSALKQVVDTLELLKLAELENFFGDECVQVAKNKAQSNQALTEGNTAVIYSVILGDRTQLILRSPNGSMRSYPVEISQSELEIEIDRLRYLLELWATEEYLPQAQKIYNLLIRPLEADLVAIKPSTLVFINDGVLRKVPMAALHDGQTFLIEKYPIGITPSLTLTTSQTLNRNELEALSLGLTVEKPPFAALTNVKAELNVVETILGGTELIDQDFTFSNLQAQLLRKSYPIVHMATHGKFGVDAESTFLLGYDRRISLQELDNLLRSRSDRQPVKLLTLSACQTAAGDNRSALGIAGVAVRAGVETALATLWYINDEATVPLIEEFYRQLLQPNITKAQALQRAKLKMIADPNYSHPAVWSPFILIGNWL
ncbi:MAG TPA: hypothetical protein DCL61_12230 [Cyanobacteria bacterium UBA12227]|nr:hypothetical protein [Cyanobacteria bacterium UBA12227]HAX85156.1 hypothetical protein [Cyanobacteria bacterium UBA11370]